MNLRLALTFCLGFAACGPAVPPPAGPMPPPAADNGQPRMQATLQALAGARAELAAATPNKGGHRAKALELVDAASAEVQAGEQYAAQHPHEIGPEEGAAEPQPVDDEVAGGNAEPHMRNAIVQLREARKQLHEAAHDKGGHRKKAMELISDAIKQTHEGIKFSEHR